MPRMLNMVVTFRSSPGPVGQPYRMRCRMGLCQLRSVSASSAGLRLCGTGRIGDSPGWAAWSGYSPV